MPWKPTDEKPIEYPDLPPGWELREYTNMRGRKNYACYVNGERVSYGIGTPVGAVRAARKAQGGAGATGRRAGAPAA